MFGENTCCFLKEVENLRDIATLIKAQENFEVRKTQSSNKKLLKFVAIKSNINYFNLK